MKLTDEQKRMSRRFLAKLEQSRVDRGNAILKAQREADQRPAEEIVRQQRETEWDT